MKLRGPTTPGEIWIHYDRRGAGKGEKPAAIQVCDEKGRTHYLTAHRVVIDVKTESVFEPMRRQPVFYFRVKAGSWTMFELQDGGLLIEKRKRDRVQKARPVKGEMKP